MRWLDLFWRRNDGRAGGIVPMAVPPKPMSPGMKKLTAVVGSAALGLVAVVSQWEGKRNDPYADLIGKMTVCFGETNVPMRRYSDAECKDMLAGSLAVYASAVLARNPELSGHDAQLLAATSLAYNAGAAGYSRSTVAKRFSEGRWISACNAFRSWAYAGGKRVQGLVNRREAEVRICLRDIPERYAR